MGKGASAAALLLGVLAIAGGGASAADRDPAQAFREAWFREARGDPPGEAVEAYREVERMAPAGEWIAQAARLRRAACLLRDGRAKEARDLLEECPCPEELRRCRDALRSRTRPVPEPPREAEVQARIAELDSDDWQVREKAMEALDHMGPAVRDLLKRARDAAQTMEARTRLNAVLGHIEEQSSEFWMGIYISGGRAWPVFMYVFFREDGTFSGEMWDPDLGDVDVDGEQSTRSGIEGKDSPAGEVDFRKVSEGEWGGDSRCLGVRKGDVIEGTWGDGTDGGFLLRREPPPEPKPPPPEGKPPPNPPPDPPGGR